MGRFFTIDNALADRHQRKKKGGEDMGERRHRRQRDAYRISQRKREKSRSLIPSISCLLYNPPPIPPLPSPLSHESQPLLLTSTEKRRKRIHHPANANRPKLTTSFRGGVPSTSETESWSAAAAASSEESPASDDSCEFGIIVSSLPLAIEASGPML